MVSLPRVREKYPQMPGKEIVVPGIVVPDRTPTAAMLIPNKADGRSRPPTPQVPARLYPGFARHDTSPWPLPSGGGIHGLDRESRRMG